MQGPLCSNDFIIHILRKYFKEINLKKKKKTGNKPCDVRTHLTVMSVRISKSIFTDFAKVYRAL